MFFLCLIKFSRGFVPSFLMNFSNLETFSLGNSVLIWSITCLTKELRLIRALFCEMLLRHFFCIFSFFFSSDDIFALAFSWRVWLSTRGRPSLLKRDEFDPLEEGSGLWSMLGSDGDVLCWGCSPRPEFDLRLCPFKLAIADVVAWLTLTGRSCWILVARRLGFICGRNSASKITFERVKYFYGMIKFTFQWKIIRINYIWQWQCI